MPSWGFPPKHRHLGTVEKLDMLFLCRNALRRGISKGCAPFGWDTYVTDDSKANVEGLSDPKGLDGCKPSLKGGSIPRERRETSF